MPAKKPWPFAINPFLTATKGSYRTMQKIGDFTLNALSAYVPPGGPAMIMGVGPTDPTIFKDLRDRLRPIVEDYRSKYADWGVQKGKQKGFTSTLAETMALLRSEKIEEWDLAIQSVYRRGTPSYQMLLPHYRTPFQTGPQGERIAAVRSLKIAVASDDNLPETLSDDIEAFLATFENSLADSGSKKNKTVAGSDAVEDARIVLGNTLYGIMGQLMDIYNGDPEKMTRFFDLETIRNSEQKEFRHSIKAGTTLLVMTHTFDEDEEIRLINDGKADLKFFLALQETDGPGAQTVTVAPGKEQKVMPAMLGNAAGRFLKVMNNATSESGHYTVILI